MKTIADITQDLRGQLCWGVRWDNQLNMSMSFGEPHLEVVREPYTSKSKSSRIQEGSSYRTVKVTGEWWLWIFCAHWKLRVSDLLTATNSSSARKKMMAMSRLDGQKLKDIRVNPLSGTTEFAFDLGATLLARRYEQDDADIWTLYKSNGFVLAVRGDGTFTYARGTTPRDKEKPRQIGTPNRVRDGH